MNEHHSLTGSHQNAQEAYPSVLATVAVLFPVITFLLYLAWKGIYRLVK